MASSAVYCVCVTLPKTRIYDLELFEVELVSTSFTMASFSHFSDTDFGTNPNKQAPFKNEWEDRSFFLITLPPLVRSLFHGSCASKTVLML